jgi:hypothetical protein
LPTWVQPVAVSASEHVTTGQQNLNQQLEAVRAERAGEREVV